MSNKTNDLSSILASESAALIARFEAFDAGVEAAENALANAKRIDAKEWLDLLELADAKRLTHTQIVCKLARANVRISDLESQLEAARKDTEWLDWRVVIPWSNGGGENLFEKSSHEEAEAWLGRCEKDSPFLRGRLQSRQAAGEWRDATRTQEGAKPE